MGTVLWDFISAVLYPMLFNLYVKPLEEVLHSFAIECHKYADKT